MRIRTRLAIIAATVAAAGGVTYQFGPVTCACNTPSYHPVVTITAPVDSSTVSGTTVAVSATASGPRSITNVQFKLDGSNLGAADTTAPYGITWNSTGASNALHTISAVVKDSSNDTDTDSVSVTVANGGGGGGSANRYVSTTGTDTGNCSSSGSPCLTLNYAYTQAVQGDIIQMACGTYVGQTVAHDATKDSDTSYITVQPASTGCVTVGFQTNLTSSLVAGGNTFTGVSSTGFQTGQTIKLGAWNMVCSSISSGTFSGCSGATSGWQYTAGGQFYQGQLTLQGSTYLKLSGINAADLEVTNGGGHRTDHLWVENGQFTVYRFYDGDHMTFTNNTIGPYTMERPPYLASTDGYGINDLTFTNNVTHDMNSVNCNNSTQCSHMECLFVIYIHDSLFDSNRWYNCSGTADVFVQDFSSLPVGTPGYGFVINPAASPPTHCAADPYNLIFSNNYFGSDQYTFTGTGSVPHAFELDGQTCGSTSQNIWLYNNSAFTTTGDGIYEVHGTLTNFSGMRMWGNVGNFPGTSACGSTWDYKYNVYNNAGRAGVCDATELNSSTTINYVDAPHGNLDLTGSAGPADNFVPVAKCVPTVDIHGTARANPCDAGGFER